MPASARRVTHGGIESVHVGHGGHAFPECVEAPSVECVAVVLHIFSRVAGVVASVPDSGWLIGFYAGPADLLHQQAAGSQDGIAQHLAIHAETRPPGQETVLWILFDKLWGCTRRLPVGRRQNQLLIEAFHIPAAIPEIHGQPIKQFWMTGPRAHHSKILSGFHDPSSKYFLPYAVHRYPRGQRIGWTNRPLRQAAPVRGCTGRQRWQKMRHTGAHPLRARVVDSAGQHIRIGES